METSHLEIIMGMVWLVLIVSGVDWLQNVRVYMC